MSVTDVAHAQLFCFSVPRLEGMELAISMAEVLEVSTLEAVMPVPFASPSVIGLAMWRNEVVTVIDLASALTNALPQRAADDQPYVITIIPLDDRAHLAAVQALPGSGATNVPRFVQRVESLTHFFVDTSPVREVISVDDRIVVLLDLPRLFR